MRRISPSWQNCWPLNARHDGPPTMTHFERRGACRGALFVPDCWMSTNSMFTRRQWRLGSRECPKVAGTGFGDGTPLPAALVNRRIKSVLRRARPQRPGDSRMSISKMSRDGVRTRPTLRERRPRSMNRERRQNLRRLRLLLCRRFCGHCKNDRLHRDKIVDLTSV